MSEIVQSDGVGALLARESSPGVQPTANWLQIQPNPGGITDTTRQNTVAERNILSPNLTPERGQVVGYDVSPQLVHDLTKDFLDMIGEPLFRSATKHSGGTGLSLFRPSAVVNGSPSSWTVAADGAVQSGTLLLGRGFTNAANNGLHVATTGSTSTATKTADALVSETPPTNATLEIAGFQGTSGDITLDSSGNLLSTTADFTTMGITPGQMLCIGDVTSGAAFAFATLTGPQFAVVVSVVAHKITLKRRTFAAGVDAGTSKTIRLLFTKYLQNVPMTDESYLSAPTLAMEISEPGADSGAATDYTYLGGLGVDSVALDIPVESKVTATIKFVGMNVSEPATARATGASTAYAPLASQLFSTASQMYDIRLLNQASEARISEEVNSAKLNFSNTVKPRKQLGLSGAGGLIYSQYVPTGTLDCYVLDNGVVDAVDGNTDCTLDMVLQNGDGGVAFDLPMVKLRKGTKTYAQGAAVMISVDLVANRDPNTGILYAMSQFAYLP